MSEWLVNVLKKSGIKKKQKQKCWFVSNWFDIKKIRIMVNKIKKIESLVSFLSSILISIMTNKNKMAIAPM